jgi:predicted MFS family arabinose efflux permease
MSGGATASGTAGGFGSAFSTLRIPHFGKVYAVGAIWSIARWGLGFLGAFVANDLTGSPRLVQLTGSAMWGPLLLGGLIGGSVSDRFDRRRTVLAQLGVLFPLSVLLGVLALQDALRVWMIYPFMVLVGFGWIVDMTARRALVYDLVGGERVNGAMALESLSSSAGLFLGALVGGTVVQTLGVGPAYLAVAGALAAAAVIMWRLPAPVRRGVTVTGPPAGGAGTAAAASAPKPPSFLRTVTEGLRALPGNLALVSILGVTVFVDFFHFCYFPILQVMGRRVGASPAMIGLLSAAVGAGMMLGSLWVAIRAPHRGRVYVGGSLAACLLLVAFAVLPYYGVMLGLALLAGVALGLFGSTQSALAITATSDEMRGRAMGLMSMAIGALPVGMYALGELAQAVGAPVALVAFNLAGFVGLLIWLRVRPEVLSVR